MSLVFMTLCIFKCVELIVHRSARAHDDDKWFVFQSKYVTEIFQLSIEIFYEIFPISIVLVCFTSLIKWNTKHFAENVTVHVIVLLSICLFL